MKSARSSVLDRLQGIWYVAELEIEGNPVPPGEAQIVVKGDRFTSVGMGAVYQGKIIVDESQEPAAIDMKFTKGTEKGNTNRGIFEFQGDSWRLCLQTTGKDCPATFATAHGTGLALESSSASNRLPKPKQWWIPLRPAYLCRSWRASGLCKRTPLAASRSIPPMLRWAAAWRRAAK